MRKLGGTFKEQCKDRKTGNTLLSFRFRVWNSNNYLVCSVYVELWMCVRVQQTVWVCLALLKSGCRSWRNFSLQALILFLHTEVLSRFLHPAKLFNTTEGTNPLSDSVWLEEAAHLRSFDHQVDLDSLNMMVLLFEVWSYWWQVITQTAALTF